MKINGRDVKGVRGQEGVWTSMAEVYKLAHLPVEDLIGLFTEPKDGCRRNASRLFEDFELQSIMRKRLHELSTGQQKMFGNIMAVSFSPTLVLLDGSFDKVDENRRRLFIEILMLAASTSASMTTHAGPND